MDSLKPKVSKEQLLYANILNAGMLIGLAGLLVTFVLYTTGVLDPLIPLKKIPEYWILSVHEYLSESGISAGWAWLGNLNYGDMLNFLPIAFLSLLTIICYLSILPALIKNKDTAFIVICILEVLVLLVAASGILGTGGH
jgi:hypothetical protein